MIPVRRLGYAVFETPDVARISDYYESVMGLVAIERSAARAVMATKSGQIALIFEKGSSTHCPRLSLEADPAFDLADAAKILQPYGIAVEMQSDIAPGVRKALAFTDPKGTRIEILSRVESAQTPENGEGISPVKFGHIAFTATTAKSISDFYCNALGFRVSDWIETVFAFLRCGPDHHTCNFIDGPNGMMHHMAFELKDWAHVLTACDLLSANRKPIIWGPGRHEVGHNIFIYHRDPDDHIVELFTEIDLMKDESLGYFDPRPWHRDRPQRPKVWGREEAAPQWGLPPSADFRRAGEQHLARQGHNG
jgi:catechol 2,3-dioxygenase-like lactoylglutathione lyase family enzyme